MLQQCMHCGMCLPSCPTFVETGRERNSPRGRIALMRAVAEGELALSRGFAEEMNYCLGCLACTTACPAGVDYTMLLETARAEVEEAGVLATPRRSFLRWVTMRLLFTRPRLLRAVGRGLWVYQASGAQRLVRRTGLTRLLPAWLRELEPATPVVRAQFSPELIAPVERPAGAVRHRVLVLTGCMQDLLFSDVNRATVDVLLANGCEVHTPAVQACCGSLHAHNGDPATARLLARRQLDAVDLSAFDAIISNAGGCGSHLRHYDRLLADDPRYAPRAAEWSRKVRDVHEWLVEAGFRHPGAAETGQRSTLNVQRLTLNGGDAAAQTGTRSPGGVQPPSPKAGATPSEPASDSLSVERSALNVERCSGAAAAPLVVAYHESCHLCHGQKVSRQPREVLRAIPGVEPRECAEATWCCGSAGVYNLTQPATATWLQERKVAHLRATGASVVATANPGCHLQIESGLAAAGVDGVRVAHPVVLLAEAYRRERAGPGSPAPAVI